MLLRVGFEKLINCGRFVESSLLRFVLQLCCVTLFCVVLLQVEALPRPEETKVKKPEHLDVDPDVIGPVDSPLKHLETAQSDKKYVEFINDLYKNDKSKTPLTFEEKSVK